MQANHLTPISESGFARAVRRLGPYMIYLLAVMLFASCGKDQKASTVNFEAPSVSPIEGQQSYDRILNVASLRELFELPAIRDEVVIAPAGVFADTMGCIYVADESDYRIHRFDSSGNYVTSFGEGQGMGPGEIMGILNFGAMGDSMVSLIEFMPKEVSYFDLEGSFLRSERLGGSIGEYPDQHVFTRKGRNIFQVLSSGKHQSSAI